jgi:hypothetical protein
VTGTRRQRLPDAGHETAVVRHPLVIAHAASQETAKYISCLT